jgi:enamine deaminase RidA (YjgF/YER057c/UK114 family)
MPLERIAPETLVAPVGYSHGVVGQGRFLFVAGQTGCARDGRIVPGGLVAQFAQALDNVLAVVDAAGGKPEQVARMTLYVTSKSDYGRDRKRIGAAYRERMGKHYPAMTLVEVASLLDDAAQVEIEATAVL